MSEADKPADKGADKRPLRAKKRKHSEPVPFGPYRLLNLLGQGGMGRVYRAVRYGPEGGEEELALKILDRRATSTSSQVRALVDEVRLGQLLRHPNIVRTDELRKVGDSYCIAMEYVDGWPLDRLVGLHKKEDQPIPLVTVLELMLAISEALTYAHNLRDEDDRDLGLVHRDLKPGNVMIARDGSVKLMDFGTAKSASNLYQTEDGETRGTPLYMSPEQVMGHDLDQRSDIFSLGSILYELVMLEPCFRGSNLVMVMRNVADADLDEQREDMATAAAALEPIFSRCMEQEPKKRFQNVPELIDELRTLHEKRPPGPSVGDWLDSLRGHTPDSTTGDFGAVAVPGTTGDLPSINIEPLASDDLKAGRPPAGVDPQAVVQQTALHPEYTRTQKPGEAVVPAPGSRRPVRPVAPETADLLATNEIAPLPARPAASDQGEAERRAGAPSRASSTSLAVAEPGVTTPQYVGVRVKPTDSTPDEPTPAAPTPTPTAPRSAPHKQRRAAGARRTELLQVKRTGVGRFWLKQALRLSVVVVVSLAFLPMLPKDARQQVGDRVSAVMGKLTSAAGFGSSSAGRSSAGWENSPFVDKVVHVDAGELHLGSAEAASTPLSTRQIAIPPFDMMAYEVTVRDFENWCDSNARVCDGWKGAEKWQDDRHAVVGVTWSEAAAFCENWGGRLPTESEWEIAARGPGGRTYPWGSKWANGRANYCDLGCVSPYLPTTYEDDGIAQTAPVDSFAAGATAGGIYNLAGNASEWTLDCWSADHSRRADWRASTQDCKLRVKRGGSWKQPVATLSGWHRSSMASGARSPQVGFRCLRGRDPF
jgi:serine/threonine-protein kinase